MARSDVHQHLWSEHDPDARCQLLARDGIDRALLCISNPLGIEALDGRDAEPLLEAHNAAGLADLDRCGPLLERLERRDAPLLVHPGPGPWRDRRPQPYVVDEAPAWWLR